MNFLFLALAGLLAGTAHANPRELRGTWIGALEGYPIQHVIKDAYVKVDSAQAFSGDVRYGITGYRDERSLVIHSFEGAVEGTAYRIRVLPQYGVELELAYDTRSPDRMTGHVAYRGEKRPVTFVRTSGVDPSKVQLNRIPVKPSSDVALVYLSTPDCTWCRHWEKTFRGRYFQSAAGKSLRFVEVKGATLKTGVLESDWPAAEKDVATQVGSLRGVPRFVVVVDRRVVANHAGLGGWELRVEPLLQQILAWRGE